MSENRATIGKQLEKSLSPFSIIVTSALNEQQYVPAGTNGQVLTVVAGVPTWSAIPSSAFNITDGTTTETVNAGDTVTFTQGSGMTVTVAATDTVTISARLSADANNGVVFGTDGGLYYNTANIFNNVTYNDVTNTLDLTQIGGGTVSVPIADVVGVWISDFVVAGQVGSSTIDNHATLSIVGASGSGISTSVAAGVVTINNTQPTKEQFVGLVAGTNVTLGATPSFVHAVYRNGIYQMAGATNDYTILANVVTFNVAFGPSGGGAGTEQVEVVYGV